jgi:predicted permease
MAGGRDHRILQELADHLEEMQSAALARGKSLPEAEAEVLAWLGDPAKASEELLRCEPGLVGAQMSRWAQEREDLLRRKGSGYIALADMLRDLRLALRGLGKKPLFSGVSILVLALGIGATTAIFTLLDAIILSPLPFEGADRIVAVQHAAPGRGLADAGQCAAWHFAYEAESQVFQDLGMFTDFATVSVMGSEGPEAVPALLVTNGVFRAVGLTPVAGRIFTPEDDDPDGSATVMLSNGYWRSRFGGDASVIGQTLLVDGVAREIIGVTPPEVRTLGSDPSVILPLRYRLSSLFVGNIGFDAVARLRDGVTIEQAAADLNRVLPMAWEMFPGGPTASSNDPSHYRAEVLPFRDDLVGSVANILWVLMAGVGLVLVIACANVANLFLVRAEGKDAEMAVKTALGAGSGRISWEYLKESLLLGVIGGVVGLALAWAGLRSLLAAAPANLPRMDEVSIDTRVLIFTLVVSVGVGALFGMFPLLRKGRDRLVDSLKEGGRDGMRDRKTHRAQSVLAVSQMALALVLLISSGLMLRSFHALRSLDPGFGAPEEVLTLRVNIPRQEARTGDEVASSFEAMARRLAEIQGVESVGLATGIPMAGWGNVNPFYVEGQVLDPDGPRISRRHKWIGPDYLATLQIPLLMGRTVTWDDIHARAPVVLLSESLAREVFGSPEEAMGKRIAARPDPPLWKEIIGIVADVRDDGMDNPPPALVYWPHVTLGFWEGSAADQVQVWGGAGFAVRSGRLGTAGFIDEVQQAIWDVNPNLPVERIRPLTDLMADSMAATSFTMVLMGIAGAVALILGLVGVYGVISYGVSQRSRELGMRMALGAEAGQVMKMVLRQGFVLAGAGMVVGLILAFGVTRFLSALLVGVSAVDAVTYLLVTGGLMGVALLASYIPARRAANVDPMTALRAE